MKKEKPEPYKIDNWSVHQLEGDRFIIPIIVGDVNGQEIKTDTIFWLDIEKKVAMTKKDIYLLGKPNSIWYTNLISTGYKLKDLEIKGTNH